MRWGLLYRNRDVGQRERTGRLVRVVPVIGVIRVRPVALVERGVPIMMGVAVWPGRFGASVVRESGAIDDGDVASPVVFGRPRPGGEWAGEGSPGRGDCAEDQQAGHADDECGEGKCDNRHDHNDESGDQGGFRDPTGLLAHTRVPHPRAGVTTADLFLKSNMPVHVTIVAPVTGRDNGGPQIVIRLFLPFRFGWLS